MPIKNYIQMSEHKNNISNSRFLNLQVVYLLLVPLQIVVRPLFFFYYFDIDIGLGCNQYEP